MWQMSRVKNEVCSLEKRDIVLAEARRGSLESSRWRVATYCMPTGTKEVLEKLPGAFRQTA